MDLSIVGKITCDFLTVVHNVGLAILTQLVAIVKNALPIRVFSMGVSLFPILRVKAASGSGVVVNALARKPSFLEMSA